ncbi:PQQ-binding-like beta-propeller repeat protein [Pedosphaera parvula]|nr:PQQ-binding-like beta-propeller repeat protein [Pedosphaera parvula]
MWLATAPTGISSSPAVAADGTIYTAAYNDTSLYAITPDQTNK